MSSSHILCVCGHHFIDAHSGHHFMGAEPVHALYICECGHHFLGAESVCVCIWSSLHGC